MMISDYKDREKDLAIKSCKLGLHLQKWELLDIYRTLVPVHIHNANLTASVLLSYVLSLSGSGMWADTSDMGGGGGGVGRGCGREGDGVF